MIKRSHDPHNISAPHYLAKLPQVDLEITCGRARNRVRRISESTYIFGAGRECDLVLGDPQFEEVHGYFLLGPHGVTLRHLGFEPELTVDGRPVRDVALWNQARIRTGPFEFRVHIQPVDLSGTIATPDSDVVVPTVLAQRMWRQDVEAPRAELRVFHGHDRPHGMGNEGQERGGRQRNGKRQVAIQPPPWRHYSELILAP
ncbi:MAG: FHA domain-containing protein [Planctomycetia bacterium]|nr:FHA domain-containing protein [Planctomycetia bacterium]